MPRVEKAAELKLCPFCGGKAEIEEMCGPTYSIGCTKCAAEILEIYFSEEDCVEAWNNRYEPPNPPLTLEELRELEGEPVWCEDYKLWGIVKVESKGPWANRPFLCGVYHSYSVATNFEYDIEKRGLTLYRRRAEQKEEAQNEP